LSIHHKNTNELNEEWQLVKAAQADAACFDVLYNTYYKPIFVFINRRVEDVEQAADITSHVFLKALINIKKYENKGVPFSAWLFRIAFNEVNMYFRKSNSERLVSVNSDGVFQLADEVDLDDNLLKEQKMMEAIKKLDELEIQLLELRFFEKRSFAEVGTILGITENNSKVKVYRILDKLKGILKKKAD
jgi:RNA polymerase sigma-70 factor (ECF subfamily)